MKWLAIGAALWLTGCVERLPRNAATVTAVSCAGLGTDTAYGNIRANAHGYTYVTQDNREVVVTGTCRLETIR
jgi:hypothetical protein